MSDFFSKVDQEQAEANVAVSAEVRPCENCDDEPAASEKEDDG